LDILQGQALLRREKNVDLLTSCQCLTICKKLVFYLLKVYSFPKNYFNFWNILKKWHWFWPPPPLLKCHSYSHIQNLIFFLRLPPFCTMSFFLLIFLKSFLITVSLHSEMSHFIGRHSTVQLRAWAWLNQHATSRSPQNTVKNQFFFLIFWKFIMN